MQTIILLAVANIFMTVAWYWHLKYKNWPLWTVIIISWLIAFVEYCFQVPANRFGYGQFNAAQLKTIQEVITLVVFSIFSIVYLKPKFCIRGFLLSDPFAQKDVSKYKGLTPTSLIKSRRDLISWALRAGFCPKGTKSRLKRA